MARFGPGAWARGPAPGAPCDAFGRGGPVFDAGPQHWLGHSPGHARPGLGESLSVPPYSGDGLGQGPPGWAHVPSAGCGLAGVGGSPYEASGAPGGSGGLSSTLGTWNELIAGGVVDRAFIEQEAERRKQEIDRAMEDHIVQLENRCREQLSSIKQQAEYHTQMAEQQIESHKKQHLAHISRQAEIQAYSILQRAEAEKGRLGQEAARALSQQSEREKAVVLHDAMRRAEDVWRQSQRELLEQAQKKKADIDAQAKRRTEEIEAAVRQAVSRIYISPSGSLVAVGAAASSGGCPGVAASGVAGAPTSPGGATGYCAAPAASAARAGGHVGP